MILLALVVKDEDEATGDNRTLFSEVQLSGDVDESSSTINAIDADYRVSRLRRSITGETRASSALSMSSQGIARENQVNN